MGRGTDSVLKRPIRSSFAVFGEEIVNIVSQWEPDLESSVDYMLLPRKTLK